MSKAKILTILVAIVVALGGYQLVFKNKTQEGSMINEEKQVMGNGEMEKPTSGKKMAFSEFLKQDKGSYKCEVKQALSDMENSGTVYMDSGNIRGDFKTIAEGRPMDSSFIVKDGYTYSWSSIAPMGIKVKNPEVAVSGDDDRAMSGTYMWNAKQIGDYNCEDWKVDTSKFALPSGVNFTEINS